MSLAVPPFSLKNSRSQDVNFPSGRASLTCFIKEDCPTCREVMPVLAAFSEAYGDKLDINVIGQTSEGNQQLEETFQPPFAILDDSTLKVSFASDIDTVPTLFYSDGQGQPEEVLIGFVRDEWQQLAEKLTQATGQSPQLDWPSLPQWRPGCGSLSVDPIIAERLQAESENSPLRARRIEIGVHDDEVEFMFDQGFSDGLPLVPPTPERVMRMLQGTQRDPKKY